jgi:hypothetical protein
MFELDLVADGFAIIFGQFIFTRVILFIDEMMYVGIDIISQGLLLDLILVLVFFIFGKHLSDQRQILGLGFINYSLFRGIFTHRTIIIMHQ